MDSVALTERGGTGAMGWRATLLRQTGVLGKDLLQYTRIPVAIGTLLVGVVVVMRVLGALMGDRSTMDMSDTAALFEIGLLGTAFALGLAMVGEEEEQGTRAFLGRLPVSGLGLLGPRLVAAMALMGVFLVVGCVAMAVAGGHAPGAFAAALAYQMGLEALLSKSSVPLGIGVFFTGMAAACWLSRSMMAAALAGAVAQSVYTVVMLLVAGMLGNASAMPGGGALIVRAAAHYSSLVHASWAVLMIGAVVVHHWKANEGTPMLGEWLAGVWHRRAPEKSRALRIDPAQVVARHAAGWGVVVAAGMWAIGNGWRGVPANDPQMAMLGVGLLLTLAAGFLGAGAIHRGEREPVHFFAGALPIAMGPFLNARMRRLVAAAALVGCLGMLALMVGAHDAEWQMMMVLVPLATVGMASVALLGMWVRMFQRSLVVAGLLATIVGAMWMGALALAAIAGQIGPMPSYRAWVELRLWPALVAVALPWVLVHVTMRGSLLPEMNEGPRSAAGVLCLLLAALWGPLLMLASPGDLVTMLVY
jgi:hypothetical protein